MTNPGMEATSLSKTQKTFYLDDDLIRLLNAHARRTGASFTRQVTAAVIQYLFSDPAGPRPRWMSLAVELDEGHIAVDGIIDECVAEAHIQWSVVNDEDQQSGPSGVRARSDAFAEIERWRAAVHTEFEKMRSRPEEDPVEKVIAQWADRPRID